MKLYNIAWTTKGFSTLNYSNQKVLLQWTFQAIKEQRKNVFSEDSVDYFDIKNNQ